MDETDSSRGQLSIIGIIVLSLAISVLMLGYYALFSLAGLVFTPLESIYIATGIYTLIAIVLGVYRYFYGAIIPEEYITTDETLPEVPDYDTKETDAGEEPATDEESGMIDSLLSSGERSKGRQQDATDTTESTNEDTTGKPDDIPRDLYMKTIAKDSYTIEDARKDAQERNDDPKG